MRTLSVALTTLLYSTLFSAPLLAEQPQTHTMTGEMSGMSHSMTGEMTHNGMSSAPLNPQRSTTPAASSNSGTPAASRWRMRRFPPCAGQP
ncbi:hypothetical protein HAT93_04351 [Dickeya solani]|nr:hypothetical protein [Dickeya solani]